MSDKKSPVIKGQLGQGIQLIQDEDLYLNGEVPFGMVLLYLTVGDFYARRQSWPEGDYLRSREAKKITAPLHIELELFRPRNDRYTVMWEPKKDELFSTDWELMPAVN